MSLLNTRLKLYLLIWVVKLVTFGEKLIGKVIYANYIHNIKSIYSKTIYKNEFS